MTILELLQKMFNATEDQTNAFMEQMKANKIYTSSEENMDIRYGKLKTQHAGVQEQLTKANATIEELQKANAGNAELQQTVTTYQTENEQLKAKLEKAMIESDAKVALLAAGAKDIEYAMFKLMAKGEMVRGEDGKVKDLTEKIDALKTQLPDQFPSSKKIYQEFKLPNTADTGDALTRESVLKKPYAERMKLYSEDPEAYREIMSKE